MRIALFGSGSPLSVTAFQRLARDGKPPVAVVVPRADYAKPLIDAAHRERIEVAEFGPSVASSLRALSIDLICIASFPHILRGELLEFAGVNLHTSFLPRHRGIDPIFWTYYYGEESTGVTVHWLDAGLDRGDILAQRAIAVPLGKPSRQLYFELCNAGSDLLFEAVKAVEDGRAPRSPQDESQAVQDPPPEPASMRADFASWPVRRAWHYLAGMSDQRSDLVVDLQGNVYSHGPAISWLQGATNGAAIEQDGKSIRVHCRDGSVVLDRRRPGRLRRFLRRLGRG